MSGYLVPILIQPESRMQFRLDCSIVLIAFGSNPHPARKPDAIVLPVDRIVADLFQSSSSPKAGCNFVSIDNQQLDTIVPILIQPESRMQFN